MHVKVLAVVRCNLREFISQVIRQQQKRAKAGEAQKTKKIQFLVNYLTFVALLQDQIATYSFCITYVPYNIQRYIFHPTTYDITW